MAEPAGVFPDQPNRVHLLGIGGVGMAGLAILLHQAGFKVSGSDSHPNRLTEELEGRGVTVYPGHDPRQNLRMLPDWAIRSPAVTEGNPELDALRQRGIPVWVRGEVLAAFSRRRQCLAVAGAHGKTTTSAMLAHILRGCGVDAGYAVGGETTLPGRVADTGSRPAFVCEADESDGTLAFYAPAVGVLTHVEWDHVERFHSEEALLTCYRIFARQCGVLWIREDDVLAQRICDGCPQAKTVGCSELATLQLIEAWSHAQGQEIRFEFAGNHYGGHIPLPGLHNAWNGLMALAAASEVGIALPDAVAALADFGGVGRRFEKVEKNGVLLIQDYAHHPTEIRALMSAVTALNPKKLWVVFQPHRFSRTRHLLHDFARSFAGADRLALLPVYAASEIPEQGAGHQVLAAACRPYHGQVDCFDRRQDLLAAWVGQVEPGDVVIIVGAGDVGDLQREWPETEQETA